MTSDVFGSDGLVLVVVVVVVIGAFLVVRVFGGRRR